MIQQPLDDAIVDATLILDCDGGWEGGRGILIIKRQNMSREARIIIKTNQRSLELSEQTKEAKNYQNQPNKLRTIRTNWV